MPWRISCCSAVVVCLLAGRSAAATASAPSIPSESDHAISVIAGLGLAFPAAQNVKGDGAGVFAAAEYIYKRLEWLTPRAYGGVLIAGSRNNCAVSGPCDISARIVFAGVKARLMAPIPYVGPFFELGIGASAGHMSTQADYFHVNESGVFLHVPFAFGLALGKEHQFEVMFTYLSHPSQQQINGAAALGLTFPIE